MRSKTTSVAITPPPPARRLLPVKAVAARLGLSPWGVRAWVYSGKISSHKIGVRVMISEDEVERIINESERFRTA